MVDKQTMVVWFSCGAASAVAAYLAVRHYSRYYAVRIVNMPIAEEDADNRRFLADVSAWIGQPIETCTHPDYPNASAVEVWDRRKGMSFPHGAPCTTILKIEARQHFCKANKVDWHVLGFTQDEMDRHHRFTRTEIQNVMPVLIIQQMTKQDCADLLRKHGIALPRLYALGYPNANCIGCVKATSPTYWNLVRKEHPEVFAARAEQSRRLGVRLARHKNERVYLDELPADAIGRPLKTLLWTAAFSAKSRSWRYERA